MSVSEQAQCLMLELRMTQRKRRTNTDNTGEVAEQYPTPKSFSNLA